MLHLPTPPDPAFTAMVTRDLTRTRAAQVHGILTDIALTAPQDREDFVRALVVGLGGTLAEPTPTTHGAWTTGGTTLTMLGLTGMGDDLAEAIHNWTTVATRSLTEENAA